MIQPQFWKLTHIKHSESYINIFTMLKSTTIIFIKIISNIVNWLKKSPVNTFHATDLLLYPMKTSENVWFSDNFKGYRKSRWHEMG